MKLTAILSPPPIDMKISVIDKTTAQVDIIRLVCSSKADSDKIMYMLQRAEAMPVAPKQIRQYSNEPDLVEDDS